MKTFRNVFFVLLLVIFNYYGVKFTFMGLNYANDYAFIGGLFGGAVLLCVDILIIRSIIKGFAAKVEATWQDEQPAAQNQASAQAAESQATSAPTPNQNPKG